MNYGKDLQYMDFGDKRLTDRLGQIIEDFLEQPSVPIPQACKNLAATKAAYRFFSNEDVKSNAIRQGFAKSTIDLINNSIDKEVFLFASDSTNLVFTSHKNLKGIGVLRNQKAKGLNLHTTLVMTEEEVALGVIDQHCWGRKPEDYGQRTLRSKKPIEEKESYRWIESFRAAQAALPERARGIFLGDRAADIYDLFLEPRQENMHILVRALHNRKLAHGPDKIFQDLENSASVGTMEVLVCRSGERPERVAKLEIRYKNVSIKAPGHRPNLPIINMTIVSAKEISSEASIKDPIHWKLLTTLPIDSLEDAIYAIKTYSKRWLIERFHYVLKEGCKVEELQFEEAERISKAVAIYTIVACKLMYITYLARTSPDLPCTNAFTDDEWRALYCYANKTAIPPKKPMSMHESVMMLAKIGGFLGRKKDSHPGVKVIWRGMRTLENAVEMYRILINGKRCG